jgi:hypothetical protein
MVHEAGNPGPRPSFSSSSSLTPQPHGPSSMLHLQACHAPRPVCAWLSQQRGQLHILPSARARRGVQIHRVRCARRWVNLTATDCAAHRMFNSCFDAGRGVAHIVVARYLQRCTSSFSSPVILAAAALVGAVRLACHSDEPADVDANEDLMPYELQPYVARARPLPRQRSLYALARAVRTRLIRLPHSPLCRHPPPQPEPVARRPTTSAAPTSPRRA